MNKVDVKEDLLAGSGDFYQHKRGDIYFVGCFNLTGQEFLVNLATGLTVYDTDSNLFGDDTGDFKKLPKGTQITITVGG